MTSSFLRPSRAEWALYAVIAGMAAVACWGPHVAQAVRYHALADQRALCGMPHALNVLSNLPFAVAGLLGCGALLRWLHAGQGTGRGTTAVLGGLFFAGLGLTALGSSLYHWQPNDSGLLWDRAGMLVAFAGVTGLAVAGRIGERPAWVTAVVVLAGGTLALRLWGMAGQLLPWAVLQGGGMLLIVALAWLPLRPGALPVSLGTLIGWYALAKLLELGDYAVWGWTGGMVSGHSLKHAAAALAAGPVIAALRAGAASQSLAGGGYFARSVRATWRPRPTVAQRIGAGTMAANVNGRTPD